MKKWLLDPRRKTCLVRLDRKQRLVRSIGYDVPAISGPRSAVVAARLSSGTILFTGR